MAGHALRYDQEWYFRATANSWWLVNVDLGERDITAQERTRVTDPNLIVVMEDLFQLYQAGKLPSHVRKGLVLSVPPIREEIEAALKKRPKKIRALRK